MGEQYDVIVLGGGWGGISAAVAAAQAGANTLLLERSLCLGGTATNAGVSEINATYTEDGRWAIPKSMRAILEKGIARGSMEDHGFVRFSSDPDFGCTRIRFDAEDLKCLLDETMEEAGVKVLFNTRYKEILRTQDGYTVITDAVGCALSFSCRVLIDATGNSSAVATLDPACVIDTDEDHKQGATLIFRMSNVDKDRLKREVDAKALAAIIDEGFSCGALPQRILSICPIPGTNEVALNLTRAPGVTEDDPEGMTAGVMAMRQQAKRAAAFLVKRMPGMENAYLSRFADTVGVRERRRIIGLSELSGEELVSAAKNQTAVAVGCYPVDIHRAGNGKAVQFSRIEGDGVYSIPFGSLVVKGMENVLAAGKIISCDDTAYAALRVMAPVMSIGNAAGHMAAMAVREGVPVQDIDINALRQEIAADYPDLSDYFA